MAIWEKLSSPARVAYLHACNSIFFPDHHCKIRKQVPPQNFTAYLHIQQALAQANFATAILFSTLLEDVQTSNHVCLKSQQKQHAAYLAKQIPPPDWVVDWLMPQFCIWIIKKTKKTKQQQQQL